MVTYVNFTKNGVRVSDQGANFESKVIAEPCKLADITKTRTTPYHPQGNGTCERFNRTLINMLGTLKPHQKKDWKSYLDPVVHAYNCTNHEVTGLSPFYLMYWRHPRLPIDLVFGSNSPEKEQGYKTFVKSLRSRLLEAYKIAYKRSSSNKARQTKL